MIARIEKQIRKLFPKRILNYKQIRTAFKNKSGIEIGGPSSTFDSKGFLPLYDTIKSLDGCNFSSNTVWEGSINEGENYLFGKKKGYQYISDGTNLKMIKDETYFFVLSCHSLEHFANPLKAISEWKRILKNEGYILLVVPHKDNTFDHKRFVTTLDHLISDYENNMSENDDSHFEEIITKYDISRDNFGGLSNVEMLRKRTYDNFNNRCAHHHVFNTPLLVKIAEHMKFKICNIGHFNPFHIVILLQKINAGNINNEFYLNPNNPIYKKTNFPSDSIW
jgi:SAM-dependent methyltransferase